MKTTAMAILLSSLTFAAPSGAQEPDDLTLEDLIPGGENQHRYTPQDLDVLQWWAEECVYSPDGDTLVVLNPQNGEKEVLFTFDQLNGFLAQQDLNPVYRTDRLTFSQTPAPQVFLLSPGKGYALVDFKQWELLRFIPIPQAGEHVDFAPTREAVAYTMDRHLYISTAESTVQITDEPEGVVCGQSVHREEFGIHKGTFWSPDGNLLAFYRMDERMVTEYPLLNYAARSAEASFIRYPMAGMTSHQVSVGIYNAAEGTTLFLHTGDPTDRYFTNISWSPDSKKIYLIELNRDQNHSKLVCYDAVTGQLEALLHEEHHPKYVQPLHPIVFLPWDSTLFLLQSQCDGYNHLYLFNQTGQRIKQLTEGPWVVQKILGFNAATKEVIFNSNEKAPLQSRLFRVHTETGERAFFGPGRRGWHTGMLSPSGQYLIDNYSAHAIPRRIEIIQRDTDHTLTLLEAENPYSDKRMPSIEIGTLQAADDSTDLYYRLLKPADFDPEKKYPVIIYVYGGPGIRLITDQWLSNTRGWDVYMAGRGYLVFTLDNRGSSERGFEFESATFRKLGIEECKDQMKGVEFLQSLPYVDSERIGVHGWSYGGYMTTSLMLRYPDAFRAGVAGGSVIDWKYYEIMYGERYMDTPESNPEGYKACDLKELAGALRGNLLLIQDTNDPVVVPQHTLSFLQACVEARTYPDYFEYPGHGHNVRGRDRVHLFEKITRYFDQHLKP